MIAQPHWFGPSRSLFGMLHTPSGGLRGAVVVCPPLGYEAVGSYATLRRVAERLASLGIACLRIAYPGMGYGPADQPGTDQLPVWRSAIGDAASELRSMGATWVGVVGLRFSATLAAEATADGGFDALVAWDPVVNGRRYARAMKMLSAHTDRDATSDGVTLAGAEFAPPTLAAMSACAFRQPDGAPALVLQRSEASIEASLAERGVPVVQVEGTAAMLDVGAELSVVPHEIVDRITEWLDLQAPAAMAAAATLPSPVASTVHHSDLALRRDAVRIGRSQLFAMLTRADAATPEHAVLFLNNGASFAIGPGGAWIDWAEEVAWLGGLAVQVDVSGLGESPTVAGGAEQQVYSAVSAQNLTDVAAFLRARGIRQITTVGLCSGAFLALDAVVAGAAIDHVVAVNARVDKPFTDTRRVPRSAGHTNRFLALPLSKSPLFPTLDKVPTWAWRLLARAHLVAAPTVALRRALLCGARVTLLFGTQEWGLRALEHRDPDTWEAIRRHPRMAVAVLADLDHSMFEPAGRAAVEAYLRTHVWPTVTPTLTPQPSESSTEVIA